MSPRVGRRAPLRAPPLLAGLAVLLWPAPAAAQSFNSQLVGTIHNTVDLIALAVEEGAPRKTVAHLNNALRQLMHVLTTPGRGKHHSHGGSFGAGMRDFAGAANNRAAFDNSASNFNGGNGARNLAAAGNGGNGRGAFAVGFAEAGSRADDRGPASKCKGPSNSAKGGNSGTFAGGIGAVRDCARDAQDGGKGAKGGKNGPGKVAANGSAASNRAPASKPGAADSKGAFAGGVRVVVRNTTINQSASGNGVNVAALSQGKQVTNVAVNSSSPAANNAPAGKLLASKVPTASNTANKKPGASNGGPAGNKVGKPAPATNSLASNKTGPAPNNKGNPAANSKPAPKVVPANTSVASSKPGPGANKTAPTANVTGGARSGANTALASNKAGPAASNKAPPKPAAVNTLAAAKVGPSNLLASSKGVPANKGGPAANKAGNKTTLPGATVGSKAGKGTQGGLAANRGGAGERLSVASNRAPRAGALVGKGGSTRKG